MVKAYYTKYYWGNKRENVTESYNSLDDFIKDFTSENWREWYIYAKKNDGNNIKVKHYADTSKQPEIEEYKSSDDRFEIEVKTNDTYGCRTIGLNRLDVDGVCLLNKSENKELSKQKGYTVIDYILTKAFEDKVITPIIDKVRQESNIIYAQEPEQKTKIDVSEYEILSKQLNEENTKTKELEATFEQKKSDTQRKNYNDFMEFLNSVKDYIPEENNFSGKMKVYPGTSHYYKYENKIPISIDSNHQADLWLVKSDINNKDIYIVSNHYTGIDNINNFDKVKDYFTDNKFLSTFQESLKSFLSNNISQKKEKQNQVKDKLTNLIEQQNKPTSITVDDKNYDLPNGIEAGLINAIRQNNQLIKDYNTLVKDFNSVAERLNNLEEKLLHNNKNNKGNSY